MPPAPRTDPGRRAAEDRLEALLARLDRLSADDLVALVADDLDDPGRGAALAAVAAAAEAAGRADLVADARAAVRDGVLARLGERLFRPTFLDPNWGLSGGRAEDRARAAVLLADAAAAEAVADLVDPTHRAVLLEPAEDLLGFADGRPMEGSLARALADAAPVADPGRPRTGGGGARGTVAGIVLLGAAVAAFATFGPAGAAALGLAAIAAAAVRRR